MLQIRQVSLGTIFGEDCWSFASPFHILTSFVGPFYHVVQEQGLGLLGVFVLGSCLCVAFTSSTTMSQNHVDADVSSLGTA